MSKKIHIVLMLLFSFAMFAYSISVYRKMPKMHSKTFMMMGTFITVSSPSKEAIALSKDVFVTYEKVLNIFDPDSELSVVNKKAYEEELALSDELYEFVRLSADAYRVSEANFDTGAGKLIKLWKERVANENLALPNQQEIDEARESSSFKYVKFNRDDRTIRFTKQGVSLDPGGIAKGFVVDKAISALRENGIESALINAGGDIYCLGTKFGQPWRVGVNNPEVSGIIETYPLQDQAIATSGDYEQFFERDGKKYSHIVNPKTGKAVDNNMQSVTVIAHNLTSADVFATTFFILGPEKTGEFLYKNRSNMKVFMIELVDGKKKIHILGDLN